MLVAWHSDEFARTASNEQQAPQPRVDRVAKVPAVAALPEPGAAVPVAPAPAPVKSLPAQRMPLPIVAGAVLPPRELATSA